MSPPNFFFLFSSSISLPSLPLAWSLQTPSCPQPSAVEGLPWEGDYPPHRQGGRSTSRRAHARTAAATRKAPDQTAAIRRAHAQAPWVEGCPQPRTEKQNVNKIVTSAHYRILLYCLLLGNKWRQMKFLLLCFRRQNLPSPSYSVVVKCKTTLLQKA